MSNNPFDTSLLDNEDIQPLDKTLKVLTILTFIGSALAIIMSIFAFATAEKNYNQILADKDKVINSKAPQMVKNMYSPENLAEMKKSVDQKLPVLLVGLVGAGLCIFGAIQMRKQQKKGYFIWLAGELLPILGSIAILGVSAFSGIKSFVLIFPLIFIILYTIYKKNLIY